MMKKRILFIAFVALLLVLVACKKIELNPSVQPESNGIVKLPDVPAKEEPKPEEPKTENKTEEPVKEEPKPVETPAPSNEYRVRKGDTINFGTNVIKVNDLQSSTYVILDVNGETVQFSETRTYELVGNLKISYLSSNFSKDSTITLKLEDFALKDDEYIMKYRDTKVVNGETVKIDTITYDEGFKANAVWVSITSDPRNSYKVLEGKSLNVGNVTVTAIKVNTRDRLYAHVSIKPKS